MPRLRPITGVPLLLGLACAAETAGGFGVPDAAPLPAALLIENPSHIGWPSKLSAAMPINGSVVFYLFDSWYVTVVREQRARFGEPIALTTSRPLDLAPSTGYRLIVFDESFRFYRNTPYIWPDGGSGGRSDAPAATDGPREAPDGAADAAALDASGDADAGPGAPRTPREPPTAVP
jgi:hypothetical protein